MEDVAKEMSMNEDKLRELKDGERPFGRSSEGFGTG